MEQNANRARIRMNSEQTIELFFTHMHRQVVKLLEVNIWLEDISKWKARNAAQETDRETEGNIRHRMRLAGIRFTAILLIIQNIASVRRSSESLAAMQDTLRTTVQDLEDRVKEYDPRILVAGGLP